MNENRVTISKERFQEIVDKAEKFSANLPLSVPVDPFAYVSFADARAITYKVASDYFEYEFLPCPSPSFTLKSLETGHSLIFYADLPRPEMRWRIAKEIGHLVLDHVTVSNRNIMSRVDADPSKNILDVESEIFAAAFMVPAEGRTITTPSDLAKTHNIPLYQADLIVKFLANNPSVCSSCTENFFTMA